MSVKSWVGRALYKMLQEAKREQERDVKGIHEMERMFNAVSPSVVAFKIENGFVVRALNGDEIPGYRLPGFTYCKDHQAIADYIVTSAVKEKLGQQELFRKSRAYQNPAPLGQGLGIADPHQGSILNIPQRSI